MNLAVITSDGRYQVSFKTVGPVFESEPVMSVSKKLINAKPCFWDVTESYCKKRDKKGFEDGKKYSYGVSPSKLEFIRKLETKGNVSRKTLTVDINGVISVWTIGKKNEYFDNQGTASLTKTLETLAASEGNKIKIY